jgi:hypothetical protein
VPDGKTGCYLCDQAACRKATRQKQHRMQRQEQFLKQPYESFVSSSN